MNCRIEGRSYSSTMLPRTSDGWAISVNFQYMLLRAQTKVIRTAFGLNQHTVMRMKYSNLAATFLRKFRLATRARVATHQVGS